MAERNFHRSRLALSHDVKPEDGMNWTFSSLCFCCSLSEKLQAIFVLPQLYFFAMRLIHSVWMTFPLSLMFFQVN